MACQAHCAVSAEIRTDVQGYSRLRRLDLHRSGLVGERADETDSNEGQVSLVLATFPIAHPVRDSSFGPARSP